jgi:hypothetical protein
VIFNMSLNAKAALNIQRKPKRFCRASGSIATPGNGNRETFRRPAESSRVWRDCSLAEPDVLLLDEPTNHLDVPRSSGLKSFCKVMPRALSSFQSRSLFSGSSLPPHCRSRKWPRLQLHGNYSAYLVEREERREAQQRAYDNQQR